MVNILLTFCNCANALTCLSNLERRSINGQLKSNMAESEIFCLKFLNSVEVPISLKRGIICLAYQESPKHKRRSEPLG